MRMRVMRRKCWKGRGVRREWKQWRRWEEGGERLEG
jgi:hypothetical protein